MLGPSSQHLMKDRRNRESLAPPLQGDGVPDKFCFGDKILDKERGWGAKAVAWVSKEK